MTLYAIFSDAQFRAEAYRRGYLMRAPDEARVKLMWSRAEPVPEGVNFEEEALEKLRAQITTAHIQFETRSTGMTDGKAIRSAVLRMF